MAIDAANVMRLGPREKGVERDDWRDLVAETAAAAASAGKINAW